MASCIPASIWRRNKSAFYCSRRWVPLQRNFCCSDLLWALTNSFFRQNYQLTPLCRSRVRVSFKSSCYIWEITELFLSWCAKRNVLNAISRSPEISALCWNIRSDFWWDHCSVRMNYRWLYFLDESRKDQESWELYNLTESYRNKSVDKGSSDVAGAD